MSRTMEVVESRITIAVPSNGLDMDSLVNITMLVTEIGDAFAENGSEVDDNSVTELWVGIILTFLVFFSAACMISCVLYHKLQTWKRREPESGSTSTSVDSGINNDMADKESLPSYTIVSGLPSYEEALQQLQTIKEAAPAYSTVIQMPEQPPANGGLAKLSVSELLKIYKRPSDASLDNKS